MGLQDSVYGSPGAHGRSIRSLAKGKWTDARQTGRSVQRIKRLQHVLIFFRWKTIAITTRYGLIFHMRPINDMIFTADKLWLTIDRVKPVCNFCCAPISHSIYGRVSALWLYGSARSPRCAEQITIDFVNIFFTAYLLDESSGSSSTT